MAYLKSSSSAPLAVVRISPDAEPRLVAYAHSPAAAESRARSESRKVVRFARSASSPAYSVRFVVLPIVEHRIELPA